MYNNPEDSKNSNKNFAVKVYFFVNVNGHLILNVFIPFLRGTVVFPSYHRPGYPVWQGYVCQEGLEDDKIRI